MGEQFRCFCPAGNLAPNSISILVALLLHYRQSLTVLLFLFFLGSL